MAKYYRLSILLRGNKVSGSGMVSWGYVPEPPFVRFGAEGSRQLLRGRYQVVEHDDLPDAGDGLRRPTLTTTFAKLAQAATCGSDLAKSRQPSRRRQA
jgi:hypothetical protein